MLAINIIGQGKDKVDPMKKQEIGNQIIGNYQFSLFKNLHSNGRKSFTARTSLKNGEIILLDHWNLSALQREIQEVLPVMEMARKLEENSHLKHLSRGSYKGC